MRIEEYWYDAFIYEVEYKMDKGSNRKIFFGYVCCKDDMSIEYLNKAVEKKVKVKHKDAVCITINEVFSAFIDKKSECNADFLSVYFVQFNVKIRDINRVIEKIILEDPTVSYDEIHSKIKKHFTNVVEVLKVKKLEQAMNIT